jgi:hypothetical protein
MRLGGPTPSPTRRGVVSLTCDHSTSGSYVRWRAPEAWTKSGYSTGAKLNIAPRLWFRVGCSRFRSPPDRPHSHSHARRGRSESHRSSGATFAFPSRGGPWTTSIGGLAFPSGGGPWSVVSHRGQPIVGEPDPEMEFTFPITAWPPSFTCTCSTLTNCEPSLRRRRSASTCSDHWLRPAHVLVIVRLARRDLVALRAWLHPECWRRS